MTEATNPDNGPPPAEDCHCQEEAARVFANLVGHMLAPLREDIAMLRADLGVTNGQSRSLSGRVTDLEGRVDALELATCDTEPPHGDH